MMILLSGVLRPSTGLRGAAPQQVAIRSRPSSRTGLVLDRQRSTKQPPSHKRMKNQEKKETALQVQDHSVLEHILY